MLPLHLVKIAMGHSNAAARPTIGQNRRVEVRGRMLATDRRLALVLAMALDRQHPSQLRHALLLGKPRDALERARPGEV